MLTVTEYLSQMTRDMFRLSESQFQGFQAPVRTPSIIETLHHVYMVKKTLKITKM
jgi:hypothetical protein